MTQREQDAEIIRKVGEPTVGREDLQCASCQRMGCWMYTEDPEWIQCKCGHEHHVGIKEIKHDGTV
jgi:hypothetical protein